MKYFNNILETIGNTPLIKLNKITKSLNSDVFVKVESFNPGNSVKDRMAVKMIEDAEKEGKINPGGTIVEGTSGNTGMGLALAAIVKGYKLICVSNDKQSKEKFDVLRAMGAKVIVCPTNVEASDPRSYYSVSKRISEETQNSWYVNQYDNPSNAIAHYESTGPEIWQQTKGNIDGFICSVGSGGTIAGISKFLKEQKSDVTIGLSDPLGSALYNFYQNGELKAEGNSISEGIGQGRITENLNCAKIDKAYQVSDEEALPIIFDLHSQEGLLLGGSSAINVAGAIRMAKDMGPGKTIVTILCDSGSRYFSKLWNTDFLKSKNLPLPSWL